MSPRLTDWSLAIAAALAFMTGIISLGFCCSCGVSYGASGPGLSIHGAGINALSMGFWRCCLLLWRLDQASGGREAASGTLPGSIC